MWIGLVLIIAVTPALAAFGLTASPVIVLVGAIIMVVGLVLYLLDK